MDKREGGDTRKRGSRSSLKIPEREKAQGSFRRASG
jgi:hypothetical protein